MTEDIGSEKTTCSTDDVSIRKIGTVSINRLIVISISIGLAAGLSFAAFRLTMNWYSNRPVQAKIWPPIDLPIGLTAKLKTDWNGETRYQLNISPKTEELTDDFDTVLRSSDVSVRQFGIHLYDKAGFEVCHALVTTSRSIGAKNRFTALTANDHFYCSRSDYNHVDHWNVSYRFPPLSATKSDAQNILDSHSVDVTVTTQK